jgi:hypothetical protein
MYCQTAAANPSVSDSYYENGAIVVDSGGQTLLGGAFGLLGYWGDGYYGGVITNCHSRASGITVSKLGSGSFAMGGFAGTVYTTQFTNCYSASPLTLREAPDTTQIYVGGFIGYLFAYKNIIVSACYAAAPVAVTGQILSVGGLIGHATRNGTATVAVSRCYATGAVSSFSTGTNYSGGLVGYASSTTVSESWASGSVTAKGIPGKTNSILAGGLVGYLYTGSKIENCYALGDALADDPYSGGAVAAGGLVGSSNSGGTGLGVFYSFAKGSVTAQTNSASDVYAGGVVGNRNNGNIQHCASLSETVIAKSAGARSAARIYGYPTSDIGSNNYALSVMKLGTYSGYYDALAPEALSVKVTNGGSGYAVGNIVLSSTAGVYCEVLTVLSGVITSAAWTSATTASGSGLSATLDSWFKGAAIIVGATTINGANAVTGTGTGRLGNADFWQLTGTMGFGSMWSMSGVSRGYPKLANVGGQ